MSLRLQCIKTLKKILEENVFFNTLKSEFKVQDTAFANKLILTALRRKTAVDKLLSSILTKKIPNKDKILKYVLLAGSIEILYMDTPDYAVINEYVEISKKLTGKFSSSMVNAVLHKVALHKDDMKDKALFPKNFFEILKQDYTKSQISSMQQMLLIEPSIDISLKENPDLWAQKLNGVLFENGSIRLSSMSSNLTFIDGYNEGSWWVQDLAASLPICFFEKLKDKKVLDVCAAPGGKTAQLLSKGALVTALDISAERLKTLNENITRLKLEKNLTTICADAEEYLDTSSELFDFILLDAPCSATGTFRKHPEVLHFKTLNDINKQAQIQKTLLEKSSHHLAPNGQLLYCTCSISKTEGEKQISEFLNSHQNFKLTPLSLKSLKQYNAKIIDKNVIDNQVLRTLPYHNKNEGGMDSFFAACLTHKN